MYDTAIVGGGPAGVSAAINAKLLGLNFIWFGSGETSQKVSRAELIKNYPGLPDVRGEELAAALKNHVASMDISLTEKVITGIYDTGGKFSLLAGTEDFEARSVILCIGVQTVKPIEGEERFLGRGVSYCATCDGMLYKGKNIAVLTYDKKYERETEYLCGLAANATVMPFYKGYSMPSSARVVLKRPLRFEGDERVRRVVFDDGSLETDGVFVLKNAISPSALMHGLTVEDGHIRTDRAMRTDIEGVFAAGDCTGRPYQYAKSVGEGNVAAHSAAEYLSGKRRT